MNQRRIVFFFLSACLRSTSGGREGGGSRSVCHEDPENSEGTWQQSSVYGLVQGQEEDRQLLTGRTHRCCYSALLAGPVVTQTASFCNKT